MARNGLLLALATALVVGCSGPAGNPAGSGPSPSATDVTLLTTTSFQDTDLGEVLLADFKRRTGYEVKLIAVGTGAALKMASQGEGDVLLAHAPEQERQWMAQGNGTSRRLVMYNDFVVAGPAADPAKIKGLAVDEAFKRIAAAKKPFVSRDDSSGTHIRELALWKTAGVTPKGQDWYVETGQGMGLTLTLASEQERYCLTDRSTFLALRARLDLRILVENDGRLLNLYHVMTVSQQKFPKVNAKGGQAFADYLVSPEAQKLIGEFGKEKFGQALFTPAAGKMEEEFSK